MARRENSLFTDREFLSLEGRSIKHIGLIREFGTPNWKKKVSDSPISLMGIDIETDYKTSELKLLGVWNGEKYSYYTDNFLSAIYTIIKHCDWNNKALAYWNKLDPFVIFKQFLLLLNEEQQLRAMKRYGKVGGKWNRKEKCWSVTPLVEVNIQGTGVSFGVKQVIRSSMQFFIRKQGEEYLNTVWAYDIASLYKNRLESEALGEYDEKTGTYPNARLKYYSKMGEEFHKVDWNRYKTDLDFQCGVLKSNELDARAVYDLGLYIQEQFKEAFKYYPRTLISTGSIARASIVATLMNKYYEKYKDRKEAEKHISDDVTHIGLIKHIDKWAKQVGDEAIKDFSCLSFEAYSGGYIEAIKYGHAKEGYLSDISSAYIYFISTLLNLKNSKMTTGTGAPPSIANSYCFIRGYVNIPIGVHYQPLTVKHLTNLDTNVRAVGEYRASYTKRERDYLVSLGATFKDETWYNIETDGTLSPIAEVMKDFTALRYKLIKEGNSAEFMVKKASASGYGILFEATNEYEENNQFDVERIGYRAGEFLNSVYASVITSEVRLLVSKACNGITANGGEILLIMTDCVHWEGTADMLPRELWRENKTLGYFEKPVKITNMAYLGTGRYSYTDPIKGRVTTKNRGLNVSAIHDPEGIDLTTYDWNDALKIAERDNTLEINVKVRSLVSIGMILHSVNDKYDENGKLLKSAYTIKDLGLVDEVNRKVDLITGLSKRTLQKDIEDIKDLTRGTIGTKPLYFGRNMFGLDGLSDQTLPLLRNEVMKRTFKSARTKDLKNRSNASMSYAKKHADDINETLRNKYQYCKSKGYNRNQAKKMSKWSWDKINETIKNKKEESK